MSYEELGAGEVVLLGRVAVRRCAGAEEVARVKALLRAHHYLGLRGVVGESLSYVAEADGQWLAVLVWAAAALKCAARDAWIGWHPSIRWQRLQMVANNVRFLTLPGTAMPNLASRVLGLNVRRMSEDWRQAWGHGLLLAETFVDPARFAGTCYRAAGWLELGRTRGFARQCGGWRYHGVAKVVLVRELQPGAREKLRDPRPAPVLSRGVATMKLHAKEVASLLAVLKQLPDPRQRRGVRHPKTSLLAVAVAAALSGARSLEALAQWVRERSQGELARLGFRKAPRSGRIEPPSEPTLRRFLQNIDAEAVDRAIGAWLVGLGLREAQAVALDGKTLRGARRKNGTQVHLLSALAPASGLTMAQRKVDTKSNEIPAAVPCSSPWRWPGSASLPTRCTPSASSPSSWCGISRRTTASSPKAISRS